jgi:hypothetical protein
MEDSAGGQGSRHFMKYFLVCLAVLPVSAESLHYTINWPSGLSLGEATLQASHAQAEDKSPEKWSFSLDIDASVPGFAIRDGYKSSASSDLCAVQLDKTFTHGSHKGEEHITFDQKANQATRQTSGGGKNDFSIPSCARDALTFLQFARRELAQGRLVPSQPVVFGALYQVRMEFAGSQSIKINDKMMDADRIVTTIKGPSSDLTVEIFFSHDAARTPVMARLPLALGTFSVELAP